MSIALHTKLATLVTIACLGLSPAISPAGQTARVVPDFTVFVDPPTGFVFVKLPAGWKFVGKADLAQVTVPAAGTVNSLLESNDDDEPDRAALAVTPR